ncbi:hypothetical protein CEXT_601861 [Caerostris extrusa]|uniref:Uncharacterized protein n=1 Tax=Caerostris extrusa TaxID=172846 RepID=A0AAV4MRC3_CAEEX|nr:hypothetical protein CEXT_601861 [Caerostris extrusa]
MEHSRWKKWFGSPFSLEIPQTQMGKMIKMTARLFTVRVLFFDGFRSIFVIKTDEIGFVDVNYFTDIKKY